MARRILVANWKNHPDSLEQAKLILKGLSKKSIIYKKLSTFIAPPYTYFESVSKVTNSFFHLASQDIDALVPVLCRYLPYWVNIQNMNMFLTHQILFKIASCVIQTANLTLLNAV